MQAPIDPPYKTALEAKRGGSGGEKSKETEKDLATAEKLLENVDIGSDK